MPITIQSELIPILSRYEIDEKSPSTILGVGGMGVVIKARDRLLNKEVAIKTIRPKNLELNDQTHKMFFREAMANARLSLENPTKIVPVYNYGIEDEFPFMEMELLHGGSLGDRMKEKFSTRDRRRKEPLFSDEIIKIIFSDVCEGLGILHKNKAYHADIKPPNILFSKKKEWNALISDLGLARIERGYLSTAGVNSFHGGTYGYTRQLVYEGKQKADIKGDLYSLGVIFLQLLTGELLNWSDANKEYINDKKELSSSSKYIINRACQLLGSKNFNSVEEFNTHVQSFSSKL